MITDQLNIWTGDFGKAYVDRNSPDEQNIAMRLNLWSRVLQTIQGQNIDSILEVGANIGLNLRALKYLLPSSILYSIEPFKEAITRLIEDKVTDREKTFHTSVFDMGMFSDNQIDLVFTSGVLIHIHPSDLKKATDNIVRIAKKYIVCIEYFSDVEQEIKYRNLENALFKRDFGSFYLDNYSSLEVRDHGFFWKRTSRLDNLTWWIFEKK